ncbi:hypothetical protein [Terrabacter sp. Soil810]|uniref:hypothetical protein n=1 Tax=Terrabacter sp. Soil810 TaxID=1736418 RepID=UPI00070E159E|nr:hypothetical protein [Terrabacter sp. Soil810]KRF45252.1 hypothetical protein ASG96_21865 [Terrabacter sp. Soil810]
MDDETTLDDETGPGIDAPADDAFTDHFTSPIYDDAGDELAPFGTDEGADLLADWAARTDELGPTTTVRDLLADGLDDPADVDGMLAELDDEDGVDAATVVVGAGFTLLRLTGQIDDEGRTAVLRALAALEAFHGEQPQLSRMRDDLESFV